MPANYVLLERIELNATAASITFSNIPQTGYTDLKIVTSALGGATEGMYIQFNGSTSNFTGRYLIGDGSTVSSGVLARYVGSIQNQTVVPNNTEIYITNYTSSNFKPFSIDNVQENNATLAYQNFIAGLWSSTSAITSITIEAANSFRANSTFSLYGVANANTTPAIAPKADGGNIIDFDGTYWIHTFTSSGTFTPQTNLTCDYLVVAGGGGGGSGAGGGGGAGGFLTGTGASIAATPYTITVGAGGAGGVASFASRGITGSDSVFSSFTATGGGFGGAHAQSIAAGNGGSGGGAGGGGNSNNTAGTGTSGQGTNGGTAFNSSGAYGGGGGGGAGVAGSNGSSTAGGNGGNGTASSYSGTSVTYAGGGGAGTYSGGGGTFNGGTGGTGGGGNAATTTNGSGANGTANRGGGGGAGTYTSAYGAGGAGGSGIVIIRYLAS